MKFIEVGSLYQLLRVEKFSFQCATEMGICKGHDITLFVPLVN